MSKELIVSYQNSVVKMAILNDGLLEQLHEESDEKKISVGDIYLGKTHVLLILERKKTDFYIIKMWVNT